jgi:hypothetical protein
MMPDPFFEEKFDDFRVEVIDRLARIETQHARVIEHLARLNGSMEEHADTLREHEKKLARMRGAASILVALIASAVTVIVSRIRFWLAP